MLSKEDVQKIIDECRVAAKEGLRNGTKSIIPQLKIDFIAPPADFLGKQENPAIFVNRHTYSFLGKHHASWVVNQTIAVKERFLENAPVKVIGILAHETGHAFNVAAKIENSEANAYIFEIEVLLLWHKAKNPILFGCSTSDLLDFFKYRLPNYRMGIKASRYLESLVEEIEQNTIFNSTPAFSCAKQSEQETENLLAYVPI
jgi:hypothetical protein